MNAQIDRIENIAAVRCFVLAGEDAASRERARDGIVARIEKTAGPCAHEKFDPSVESAALFAQRMLSTSLFAETRVFHFRHAQTIRDDDLAELDAALTGAVEGVYCVIEIDEGKKDASRVMKKLHIDKRGDACLCLEFERPADWAIAEWIVANTPLLVGRRIAKADAEYLADRVGYDVDVLHSELQKIDLFLEPNAPINRAAIDRIAVTGREMTPFELAAAVGRQDFPLALRIIEALFTGAAYMPLVVSALSRHFWALFRIKKFLAAKPDIARRFAASKGSKNQEQTATGLAIGKAAGLLRDGEERKIYPVLIKSGVVEQANRFSDAELAKILAWLLEFDVGVKTGKIEPTQGNLQLLCCRIVRARAAMEGNA